MQITQSARRVLLDTDIGTDIDDLLALALLLGSPEVELVGVTCVYGDVALRGKMVQKVLRLANRPDVPVRLGASLPLLGLQPVYWEGHEGVGLLDADEPAVANAPHAVDFLINTVLTHPGTIDLLAIGPLTNVALAVRKEPRFVANLRSLVVMGGVFRGPNRFHLPVVEHNIACDPEAAHVVFAAGAMMTLVPLDVTTEVSIRPADVARIEAQSNPFHAAVAAQINAYPHYARRGWSHLHDPLAAALLVDSTLVTTEPLHVAAETQGRLTTAQTVASAPDDAQPPNAHVALAVAAKRAERLMLDRIAAPLRRGALETVT
jgi:purine nucleosidase